MPVVDIIAIASEGSNFYRVSVYDNCNGTVLKPDCKQFISAKHADYLFGQCRCRDIIIIRTLPEQMIPHASTDAVRLISAGSQLINHFGYKNREIHILSFQNCI